MSPNSGASRGTVIDATTAKVATHIPVGLFSHGVAVSPDGRLAVVADTGPDAGRGGSRSITVIDTATETARATVQVGDAPMMVAVALDSRTAHVTCPDALYVVDIVRGRVTAHLIDHARAHGVAVRPDGSEVWVANSRSDTVGVIDAGRHDVRATVDVGHNPWNLAFGADGHGLVTNASADAVDVVDVKTHRVTRTIDTGHVQVGIAVLGGTLWITNNTPTTTQAIDLASGRVLHTVSVGHFGQSGIAIT